MAHALLLHEISRDRLHVAPDRRPVNEIRSHAQHLLRHREAVPPLVWRIVRLVSSHLDERVTLHRISVALGRTPSHLGACFRTATGLTIHEFTTFLRMSEAARQIERGVKVEAVARCVGYRSTIHFYRRFKRWFGIDPSRMRRSRPQQHSPSQRGG